MAEKTINKEELTYIVSYNDALYKFRAIINEAIDKLTELAETIISLFPNSEIDSETYRELADRINDTIDYLKEV